MDAAVLLQQVRQFRLRQAAYRVGLCLGRQRRVQARHRGGEPGLQHHLVIGIPLRVPAIGADELIRGAGKAQPAKLLKQRGFQLGFGQESHGHPSCCWASTVRPLSVNRYRCKRLLGLSGMLISIRPSANAGLR